MRPFACSTCGQLVFFHNTRCLHCESALGFDWGARELLVGDGRPRCPGNARAGCNAWVTAPGEWCVACALVRTRPRDDDRDGLGAFAEASEALRRLVFELLELELPIDGLSFDLLSSRDGPVTTGHADGHITLDLAEADDVHRARMREQLREPYRTLLGHLRHETGHYAWTVLVRSEEDFTRARARFGDEREDYGAALDRHYETGPPDDWARRHVSAYATMHPAEDWAETFAHYLHLRDGLQTAAAYRVRVLGPEVVAARRDAPELVSVPRADDAEHIPFREMLEEWLALIYALNAFSRSMGRSDLYPFVLPEPVVAKLELVHELVTAR